MNKTVQPDLRIGSAQAGFTLAEVLFSLVLLALFAMLAFSLLRSSHVAMMRGNKRAEVNHVIQTAVEHFKASMHIYALPEGGCPPGYGGCGGTAYCHEMLSDYWAVYEYEPHSIPLPPGGSEQSLREKLLLVDLTIYENTAGAFGPEVGSFSFLTFEGGY